MLEKYQNDMWYSIWNGWDFDDNFFARLKCCLARISVGAINAT